MHYMRSMAYMQWQTHPAGAVRLDFQFNNDMTHQTTRWHDYTMPCLTRRWHASLTHVHDAMPLADHNGMHHWHTMACMTTMHAGVLPTCLRCMSRPCTCLRCMSKPHAQCHACYACHSHMHMSLTATHVLPTCLAILPWSGEMRARGDEGD